MRKVKSNKSRKQQRKEERIAKKAKKHEFYTKKKARSLSSQVLKKSGEIPKQAKINDKVKKSDDGKGSLSLQDEQLREIKRTELETKKYKKEMHKVRVKQLERDVMADDIEIRKLEKQLGLAKKKETAKNKTFSADGLDYLLDVCDRKNLKETEGVDNRFREDDSDFDDDLALITGKANKKRKTENEEPKSKKMKKTKVSDESDSEPEEFMSTKAGSKFLAKKQLKESDKEDDGDSSLPEESDVDNNSIDENIDDEEMSDNLEGEGENSEDESEMEDDLESTENNDNDDEKDVSNTEGEKKEGDGTWEDIYGRTRDKDGKIVTKYQPPHLRKQLAASDSDKIVRLKKNVKGLLNRLAETNIVSIASQVEQLYSRNSRNDMNETMWSIYQEALLGETRTPERLVAEHALLLAVLSANVGSEVGAHALQRCATHWHQLFTVDGKFSPPVHDKQSNNALTLLCYLYHFRLFHCKLLYDILDLLLEQVNEKTIELILDVLRTIGFSLRKDDPLRLKEFVLKAQTAANKSDSSSSEQSSRVKFLLETVMAIKNNNMNKIPNYNPEYNERLKKTLKASVRKGNYSAELKISLEDILKVDERGRWWVVGSAWTGELPGEKPPEQNRIEVTSKPVEAFSDKLMTLAKKQRMNTENRRTVFCVIMSAEDYMDAFEKLVKLGLKGPLERDVLNVLLHCLLMENKYNPYYEHLARRFCVCNRKYQVMLQFAVWDRIKELKNHSALQISHLAKFLGNLILEKNLALSVLKVVELSQLDKQGVRLMRQLLLTILLCDSEETMAAAFARVAHSKELKLFREGIRLFLHHFVLRKSKDVEGTDMALLTTRVKLADSALAAVDREQSF